MNITMTREEIRDLLNVSESAIKQICKRGKLEERLEMVGYRLSSKEKMGRNIIYELYPIDVDEWMLVQNKHHIRHDKLEDHSNYSYKRIESTSNMSSSRSKFIEDNDLNISGSTAKRWDEILIEEGAMKKDRVIYLKYILSSGEVYEISSDDYREFWKNNYEYTYQMANNERRYSNGSISEDVYENNKDMFKAALWSREDCMVVKYTSYSEAENTKRILGLIRNRGTTSKPYSII